ncbi:MAG: hypothetical protein AVO38_08060 [delta proteobacterium ML8_D]|nr:MAG: hypothetical protein AVO38_08060 [delta proteobacterium ML8_D]
MIDNFFNKYSRASVIFADQAMVSGVNFLTGLLFARFLGIEEFGRFTLAWMVVLFVNSLQMALVSSPMMAIGPKQEPKGICFYYTSVMVQQLIFGLLSFVFVFVFVKISDCIFPKWDIENIALPLASVAFCFQNQDFFRRYFFTRDAFLQSLISDVISYLGQLILLVIMFWKTSMETSTVLWVITFTSALSIIFALWMLEEMKWSSKVFFVTIKRHWDFAKWIAASAILHWSSGNLFFIVTGNLLGIGAVGAMKASQNIMGVAHILFQGFENIVPISASKALHLGGKRAMFRYLGKVTLGGGVLLVCFSLIVALKPELWLTMLFGSEYQGYGNVLRWFSLIYLLMFLGFPLRSGLRALEYTRPIFLSYFLATIFTISMSYFLIVRFELLGSMFGLFVVYCLLAMVPFWTLINFAHIQDR